ncbi:MAG: RsmE family RNA methyltransferase [Chloroflexota bacterium]
MTLHRFFAPISGGQAHLSQAQVHQVRSVLRLADGDHIATFDGSGSEWLAQLQGSDAALLERLTTVVEPSTHLTIYQALIRSRRFEQVLQKGTELGVSRFVPFVSERTVAAGDHPDRWRAIVIEAAEQCGRRIVPEVSPALSFDEALAEATREGIPYMPWEEATDGPRLSTVHRPAKRMGLIIGPEGGFSEVEAYQARQRGAMHVSLGPRILRADTAAIAAAAILLHRNGEL